MPARNTSAKNAADWIEKVSTAATYGVISTPTIRIGSAKKNQKSWTSGGVVRKTSMTKPAGHASSRARREPHQREHQPERARRRRAPRR